jgi:hypothetical protein
MALLFSKNCVVNLLVTVFVTTYKPMYRIYTIENKFYVIWTPFKILSSFRAVFLVQFAVLRIWDVYPGFRIRIGHYLSSRISDPDPDSGSCVKKRSAK